jgi:FkbM family methyltransferase
MFRRLGIKGALACLLKERFFRVLSYITGGRLTPSAYRLYSRETQFPLLCRYGTSDLDGFFHVFLEQEYAALGGDPKFVIDCGANVGYTSAYFLARFPNARVLAVEPESSNFRILCRNLAAYGDRAQALRSAIWCRETGLKVVSGQYGDGREWATQVRECRGNEKPDVYAASVGDFVERSGYERIDILKVDIEAAEAIVFSENYEGWIDRVDTFIIELHDEWCREVFFAALRTTGEDFRFSHSGKLTVAERVVAKDSGGY